MTRDLLEMRTPRPSVGPGRLIMNSGAGPRASRPGILTPAHIGEGSSDLLSGEWGEGAPPCSESEEELRVQELPVQMLSQPPTQVPGSPASPLLEVPGSWLRSPRPRGGVGSVSSARFSFLWFPKTGSAPPFASSQDVPVLFPFAGLFTLETRVPSSPSAAILSEVTGGHSTYRVLLSSHDTD